MKKNSSYWYCPKCKEELDGCHVTYQELCEYCGTAVLSVPESISQETIEEIIKAKAEGRLVMLPCKDGDTCDDMTHYCRCKNIDRGTSDNFYCANGKQLNKEEVQTDLKR